MKKQSTAVANKKVKEKFSELFFEEATKIQPVATVDDWKIYNCYSPSNSIQIAFKETPFPQAVKWGTIQ